MSSGCTRASQSAPVTASRRSRWRTGGRGERDGDSTCASAACRQAAQSAPSARVSPSSASIHVSAGPRTSRSCWRKTAKRKVPDGGERRERLAGAIAELLGHDGVQVLVADAPTRECFAILRLGEERLAPEEIGRFDHGRLERQVLVGVQCVVVDEDRDRPLGRQKRRHRPDDPREALQSGVASRSCLVVRPDLHASDRTQS